MASPIENCLYGAFVLLAISGSASADDVRPVQVQLREQEPGVFLVQWQVPRIIPVQAAPVPLLPEGCEPVGERSAREQQAAWIYRQVFRCDAGLSGRTIGIDYPFLNTSVSTVFRLSLLSGEEHARILAPGETGWELPKSTPDALRLLQRGVLLGIEHVLDSFIHVALAVSLVLIPGQLIGFFALGQLGAIVLSAFGLTLPPELTEVGVAVAVVLLAREALRPRDERRPTTSLAVAAGLVHGLGLASIVDGAGALVLAILGMDATLVVLGALVSLASSKSSRTQAFAYVAGSAAVALGLAFFFAEPSARAEKRRDATLPALSAGVASSGSQRLARGVPDAPIQSFVAIEPFETRHEVLVRLESVSLGSTEIVSIEDQPAVKSAIAERILSAATIRIDGETRDPLLDRVDFVTVDPQGVLPRPAPVREPVADALVGVTVVYLTETMPKSVELAWTTFDPVATVPTTLIDPESTRTALLSAEEPAIAWKNTLSEDPVPKVSSVVVEPRAFPVPLVSIPPLVLAGWALRRKHLAPARVALAVGVLVAPWGSVAVSLPAASVPSTSEARRILASLLPNVYRAFEFREESAAYDKLAVSVTGETLTEVYLEHRRALEMEERGGARARVEAVEVVAVDEVAPGVDTGFDAVARWTVGGTVTHFGHRHFRENRYRASVAVVPVDDQWKIRAIEVLEEERVR